MLTQTLEQKRAEFTFNSVNNIKDKKFAGDFKNLVKKTPSYILTNGLGNTLAFFFSKKKNHHIALAYIISKYLFKENEYTSKIFNISEPIFEIELDSIIENDALIKQLQDILFQKLVFTDTDTYILATEETLRLLNWLKRFVEAMIEGEEE